MNQDPAGESAGARERESLSALADGEGSPDETAALVRRWGADAELREAWHCHQVIGDALRSDELAGQGSEARFLASLRVRLAQEPVVLAPAAHPAPSVEAVRSLPTARLRRPRWAGGVAVAAGFAAVAAVLVSLQMPGAERAEATLSAAPAGGATVSTVPVEWVRTGTSPAPAARPVELGPMIRDARLDAYLDAHRQLGSGAWQAAPTSLQSVQPSGAPR